MVALAVPAAFDRASALLDCAPIDSTTQGQTATMKAESKAGSARAMTLLEVLVVIALIAFLAAVLLPALYAANHKPYRIYCVNNIKECSLAFYIWSGDNGGKLPMQIYVTNEVVKRAAASGNAWLLWQMMSNELSTPKILHCPADRQTTFATTFDQGFRDSSISYFFNLDALKPNPQIILDGDDNLVAKGNRAAPGILSLQTNNPVGWTQDRHHGGGNIGLADGSVMEINSNGLVSALAGSGTNSVRFVIP
jgi:prepilin-type N-terminal cleavage/methylation domain-containing protein/prepilin-type processing-associated H-X9-DG protein